MQKNSSRNAEAEISLAFVGSLAPEIDSMKYPAFNPAGNLFQKRLLCSLRQNCMEANFICSGAPVPSFPRMRKLWFKSCKTKLEEGFLINQLPFINLGILKTITIGLGAFCSLLLWGIRERNQVSKVIITYNVSYPHALFVLPAARLIGAKVVAVVADLWAPQNQSSVVRKMDFWLQTRSLRYYDGLIVLTEHMVRDFAPKVPFIKMNGALPAHELKILADISVNQSQDKSTFTIMYAGDLSEHRVRLLLDAFRCLTEPHYRLLISGRGPLENEVSTAAQSDKRITFPGYLNSYRAVLDLYQDADVLINAQQSRFPASRYTFPSKLIEYMATGRPVISTCTAGVKEEFSEFIFLLEEETPEGLARLIQRIEKLSLSQRLDLGRIARSYILENKTWEIQGSRIAEFIKKLTVKTDITCKK